MSASSFEIRTALFCHPLSLQDTKNRRSTPTFDDGVAYSKLRPQLRILVPN